jgi:hypothetical protein
MPDRKDDLVHLFVRDLDTIDLPERARWRPAPRKESLFMKAAGYVAVATALAALLVVALLWSFGQSPNPVSARPSASPSATATPSATASFTPSASTAPSAVSSPKRDTDAGTITGRIGYPSEFVPPITVYAISVDDPNRWFSTNTPFSGNYTRSTPSPTPSFAATWPPAGEGWYQLDVLAGTYYVVGFSNDTGLPKDLPVAYTEWTKRCMSSDPARPSPPPGGFAPGDCPHTLVRVTVPPGQTVPYIDLVDWLFLPGTTYPPRPTPR